MSPDARVTAALALVTDLAAGRWDARAVPGDAGDELDALLSGLNELAAQVSRQLVARDDTDAHAQEIMDVVLGLAAQDFSSRARVRDDDWSAVNGIAGGVNMLAEELAAASEAVVHRTAEVHHKTVLLESVISSMADGVAVADEHGALLFLNGAARRILCWDDAYGSPLEARHGFFLPDGRTPFPADALPSARALRGEESGRHVPIVALTAHAMKSDRDACFLAGMDAYVTKPVRPAELLATIARVTRRAALPALSA